MESSGHTCSDGRPSDTSSGTTTASASSQHASQTDSSPAPRSLATCVSSHSPVRLSNTEDLRTWLAQGFPASHIPAQVNEWAERMSETCGPQPSTAFASFDRAASFWRTSQACLAGISDEFSEIWPRSGMTLDGIAYQHATSAHHTSAIGLGLLPTPTVRQGRNRTSGRSNPNSEHHDGLTLMDWIWLNVGRVKLKPNFTEWMMLWPEGWTDCAPLATAKFHSWQQQHGDS